MSGLQRCPSVSTGGVRRAVDLSLSKEELEKLIHDHEITGSQTKQPTDDEEHGVKSDILKRQGTFAPWEQQLVDLNLSSKINGPLVDRNL